MVDAPMTLQIIISNIQHVGPDSSWA